MNLNTTKTRYAVVGKVGNDQLRFDIRNGQWTTAPVPEIGLQQAKAIINSLSSEDVNGASIIDLDIEDGLSSVAAKVREEMNDSISFDDKPINWVTSKEGHKHCSDVLNAIGDAKEAALMAFIVGM